MTDMEHATHGTATDIDILREMVRLAENRRTEELEHIDRVNRYNLALIAFSGSFLSLLVSTHFEPTVVRLAGFFLCLSILSSLIALRPRKLKGGAIVIDEDVQALRSGQSLQLHSYLLDLADLTERAASSANIFSRDKKRWTIYSAILLAISLISTYILYAYA